MIRKFILVLWVIGNSLIANAQTMLPAYQALQYRGPSVPVLTTTDISAVTGNTASSGGNITLQGASAVTARGVCWSTSPNPVVGTSNQTSDGTGTGVFTSAITGLAISTTYYVRAYATNSAGTGYGNQVMFTTTAVVLANIGDQRDGGIVVYILKSGDPGYVQGTQKGLIGYALTESYVWASPTRIVAGTSALIGTGNDNTTAIYNIITTSQTSYAARLCYDLVLGGKDDWYLPSANELVAIAPNGTLLDSDANFGGWWSSTQVSNVNASAVSFSTGVVAPFNQVNKLRVLAVRSF